MRSILNLFAATAKWIEGILKAVIEFVLTKVT